MEIVGPVVPNEERFSQLALRLRDTAAAALRSTGGFWFRVLIEEVALDGPPTDPNLVILLRTEQHPGALYGLRAKVSWYGAENDDPESWLHTIHDQVMEAVDADPGLPVPEDPITWVDL